MKDEEWKIVEKQQNECEHNFKIFRDSKLIKTGYLSFYCSKCLITKKRKIDYK